MAKAKAKQTKQTKQKAKDKKPAKATKAVAKKAATPDWLRKAMAIPPKHKGRPPGSKNRPKIEPQQAQAKRGKKPMATKPHYDPLDDPDLRADTKGDAPGWESPIKPPDTSLKPGNALPGSPARPDNALPEHPTKPGKPAPLPGGGVRPDNALPEEPEAETKFDEVQSGAVIPDENMQMLIDGTMGGSGDHHAMAKRIVERMKEAKWVTSKAADAGSGDTRKSKAKGKDEDEADARRKA